jgi:hypothetical protein
MIDHADDSGFAVIAQGDTMKQWIVRALGDEGITLLLSGQFDAPTFAGIIGAWAFFTITPSAPPGTVRPIVVDAVPGCRIHLPVKEATIRTGIADPDPLEPPITFSWNRVRHSGSDQWLLAQPRHLATQ